MTKPESRQLNKVFFWVWLGPGLALSLWLKDSVPWVVAMSWWAIVVSHWAAWRADEPNPV